MKLFLLSAFLLVSVSCSTLRSDSSRQNAGKAYVVTAPKIFLGEESVCLTLFDQQSIPKDAVLKVQLRSMDGETLYQSEEQLTSASQCMRVPVHDVKGDRAHLRVQVADIEDEREIAVRPNALMTFIETSKAVYRPTETARIRLITFDRWLKPADELISRVWVENSRGLVVMQWSNIRTTGGISSLSVPIAEDNLYGTWKVKAVAADDVLVAEKTFRVEEADEPQCEIEMQGNEYISATEEQAVRKICVKDRTGYPLNGKLVVRAGYEKLNSRLPLDVYTTQITGCADVPINATLLGVDTRALPYRTITLDVQFTDSERKIVQQRSLELPIAPRSYLIQFPSTKLAKSYFKAGLPYNGQVQLVKPDLSIADGKAMKIFVEARTQPWVSVKEEQVGEYTSNQDGQIKFQLPAYDEEVKQLFVRLEPVDEPEQAIAFVLRPWYSVSKANLQIRSPSESSEELCGNSADLELLLSNTERPVSEVYYQVIGRGHVEAPKKAAIQFTRWEDKDVQKRSQQKWNNWIGRIKIDLPQNKNSLTPMTRVVVFYPEENNKNIVADSHTFQVDCLNQGMDFNLQRKASGVHMKLGNRQPGSRCAVEMSSNKDRSQITKAKILKMLERFDINHEYLLKDKCEQKRLREQKDSSLFGHREQELSPFRQTVLDYSDSWDSFNDAGLSVSSNMEMNDSPCEQDVYSAGIPKEILEGMEQDRPLLWTGASKDESDARSLLKREDSLAGDLLYWNSHPNTEQAFEHDEDNLEHENEVYGSALCFDEQDGLRIAHDDSVVEKAYEIKAFHPEQITVGEAMTVQVHVHKATPKSLPLRLRIKSSTPSLFEISSQQKDKCIESAHEVIQLQVRGKNIGKAVIEVEAVKADLTCQNAQQNVQRQTSRNNVEVIARGIQKKQTVSQILCTKSQKEHKILEVDGVKTATLSADLAQIALKHAKAAIDTERSAIDVLSALAPFVYLTQEQNIKAHVKQQLQQEMIKAYQALIAYRLPDGSYSLFGGRKAVGDIALTTAIVKVLTQAQTILPYTNDYELGKSIHWIYSAQDRDGCFFVPERDISIWPMNIKEKEEVTAFVVASLAEAGHKLNSIPMINALKCAKKTADSEEKASQTVYAILAYIESLKEQGQEQAQSYLDKLEKHHKTGLLSETIAYRTLARLNLDKTDDYESIAEQLVSKTSVWDSPIKSYALIKVWKQLQTKTELKIKYNGKTTTLKPFHQWKNFDLKTGSDEIRVEGQGCAYLFLQKERASTTTEQKNFKTTVEGLDRGYGTCQKRLMKICLKDRKQTASTAQPIIKLQLVNGYKLDKKYLMSSLLHQRANLINHFRVRGRDVYLYLKFLNDPNMKSQCVDVPFVQTEEIISPREAYIQVYNYHQGDLDENEQVDTLTYSIPQECEIVEPKNESMEKRPFSWKAVQTNHYNAGPLRTVECPQDVEISCPVCETYEHKNQKEVCAAPVAALTSRLPWRFADYEFLGTRLSRSSSDKCVAVPLHLQAQVNDKQVPAEQMTLFMRSDCVCSPLTLRNAGDALLLVRQKSETEKKDMQLTSEDKILRVPQGQRVAACEQEEPRKSERQQSSTGRVKRAAAKACWERQVDSCPEIKTSATEAQKKEICASKDKSKIAAHVKFSTSEGCKVVTPGNIILGDAMKKGEAVEFSTAATCKLPEGEVLIITRADKFENGKMVLDKSVVIVSGDKHLCSPTQNDAPYAAASYSPPATYAAPAYAAPAYSAPAPAYSAPASYAAPAAYPAPSYAAPSYSAPAAYPAPSYSAPAAYPAPSYAAPSYSAPAYPAPAYAAPAPSYSAPAYAAPAYPAPAYSAPAPSYSAPAYAAPSYPAPAPSYSAPAYPAPSYSAPAAYPAPSYSAPAAYPAPSYSAPAYSAPSYSAPAAYPAPSYSAPAAYPAPSYSAPAYPAPSYSAPAYPAPSYAPPSYSAPAPSYSAPAYSAPAYPAPAYAAPAPSYSAPAYAAPAYSAPQSYPAPSYSAPAYSAPASYPSPSYGYEQPSYGYAPAVSYSSYDSYDSYAPVAYSAPSYAPQSYSAPAPAYSAPAYAAPSYSAPAYPAPSYSAPAYPAPAPYAPAYAAPSYSAPSYPAPSYAPPAYAAPAPSYAAPSYSAPAYPAPSYSMPAYSAPAPAYAMPSYSAPSYAAPSYPAPSYAAPAYAPSYAPPSYAPSYSSGYARRSGEMSTSASSLVPSFSVAPATGFGGQSYGYAIPVSSSSNYGYGSYGSSEVYTSSPALYESHGLTSYARPYYSTMEKKEAAVQADQCRPAAASCPVCDSFISLDAIGRFCNFGSVFTGKARVDSNKSSNSTTCAKLDIDKVILGEKPEKKVRVSMRPECVCPELSSNNDVIVFAPKSRALSKQHLVLDNEVYIVKKTESTKSDVYDLQARCNAQ